MNIYKCYVIELKDKALANSVSFDDNFKEKYVSKSALEKTSGKLTEDTFAGSGLSPSGKEPATHQWCGWVDTKEVHDKLEAGFSGKAYIYGDDWSNQEILDDLGLKIIQTQF